MAAAFPRVERYLSLLPNGIDSYPDCMAKASLYRTFSDATSLQGFNWLAVQPKIAAMLRERVDESAWLGEVACTAAVLALADHQRLDDRQFVDWFRDCNERLLSSRLYFTLTRLASPEMLVHFGSKRWQTFHRGIDFSATLHKSGADITLSYPPFVYPDEMQRAVGEVLRSAMAMSRARNCVVEIVRSTSTSCSYRFDWAKTG